MESAVKMLNFWAGLGYAFAMKKNVRIWDRLLRFFFGVFMMAWGFAGGPTWAYFGVYFLATGSWGYCAFYSLLNYQPFADE